MDNLLFKSGNTGQVNIDQAQGIVECFVAGIGNKDSVGDIVISGAFAKSLTRRKPRVVWGHSWNDPIGKVLEMYEVSAGDSRLPAKMRNAGIGGLYAKVQFNLNSEKGKEAFATVAFFGEEQEWSIGYKTIDSVFDPNLQANILKEVELYEVSPVLHGANQLTGTISIKGDEKGYMPIIPMPGAEMMAPQMPRIVVVSAANLGEGESSEGNPFAEGMSQELSEPDKNALQAELAERTGSKIEVMNATENSVVFKRTTSDGKTSMYRLPYHREGGQYMFGKPEPYEAATTQPQPQQNIEQKPGAPVVVPNGGIAYRSDDQQEMVDIFGGGGVQSPWGKSDISHLIELPEAYMASARDFLGPVLRHHKLTGTPNAKGIVVDGLMTANALDALQNAVKALGTTIGQAGGNIGQAIGRIRDLAQTFNPYALDGDGDGFVQDGSAFMRPFLPIKKPGFDLPDVRGKKRSGDALLDKPRSAPKLPKDKAKWTREQRNEALLAGMMEPETREDVAFLANKRPDNEGIAKYWDMSEADLTKEGNKLVNARRQATGADKEKLDEELLKVSHEFQRRAAYAETFGQEFVPPAKREAAPAMVPEADKPKAPRAAQAEMSDEEIYNERMTGVSLAEMAERLGISREEVRQREQRHMRELRDREEQRRLDRQADDALDRALEGYIERYGEDAEPPTSDSGFASSGTGSPGKVFDSLNREQIRNGEYFRDWDDLDDDEKLEMFQEVQYDYLYENYGNLGDDGLVDAMEDPKYDDEIYEYAEEVYDEIKARRTEDKQRADERAEDERYAQSEAGRAEAAEDERVGREVYAAEYEEERAANEGLPSRGNRSGEFGSNPEDSKAAQVFDAILEKYWSMWGFDAPDKDDEGFDEPFGFSSRGKDEEVKQNKLDELVGGVRDRLIAELETADPATWKPSWRDDSLPMNPITGKPYRGWNAFWLMFATHDRKYGTGRYAGFNQLKERGAIVRKGEKGVPILRPQLIKKEDEDGNVKEFLVFRGATVFNIDQTDGGDESLRAIAADLPESERLKILDDTLAELGVNVRTQNMTPHYDPTGDYVSMPEFAKGTSAVEWSSTLAHETVHWTGGASRLNRPSVTNYGTSKQTRAYEELVAEIGSAMLLAAHGIEAPFRQDHAPYIKGWIQLLKDDSTALERAFKDAQAALNYMLEKSPNLRKLFGGLDNGKKRPEVDAPDKINVPVGASEGFASLHRVRTPGSEALAGILYDDNSGELMVGFLKGKKFDDLTDAEQQDWVDKAQIDIEERYARGRPVPQGELLDIAQSMYEDSRDVGWYVYSGVTMDDVQELAAARSKGRHINALKKVKQARKASDEDQFNFFGRTERIQDVARAKSTDGFAARGVPRGNENISITKDRNGYWVMTAMVTGGRGASEENRGTRLMHYTVVGGSRRDALKTFRDAMKRDNLSFAGEDGFASRGDALRPGVLESIQNNRNLRQVVGNDSRDVAALYMGYLNWHRETEDNDGDTGGFLGSPESVNAFIELIRDGESTPYVPFENMYDANSVRIANELANEIDRYNDFVKREYAFAPKRIEGLASRGTKRLGVEPRYQDQDWVNRTQQRILRSGLDFQSLPESDRIDWANSFLDEYLNQNEMGHNLADVSNGRRISSRPDIDLMNYAEDAFNRMSDAHVRRRAQFGEEAQGLASVGRRTRRLGTKPSDAVDYVAWDPETESLFVAYKRGDGRSQMYVYEGVNSDEALAVENADSLGKAINAIKRAKNVRQATPEEVMGLADTDRREASETKKRLARLVLEETRDALKGMEVEFLSDTEMNVSDGSEKVVRVSLDPDTLEFTVSKVRAIRGGREEPDDEELYDSESALSAGDVRVLTSLFMNDLQKELDEESRIEREIDDARRELDESGDEPGVESIDVSSSSALTAVDYNPTTQELRVTYRGGTFPDSRQTYIYEGVDRATVEDFKKSPSRGRAMNEIKRAHPFRKDSEWNSEYAKSRGFEEFDVRGSEAVERVTYDPVKEELTVVYNGGRGYVYSKVTRAEADAVRSAPSKGRAINDIKRTHDVRKAEPRKAPDFEAAGWTKGDSGKWTKGDYEIEPMFDEGGNFTGLRATNLSVGESFEQESHPDVIPDEHLENFEGILRGSGFLDDETESTELSFAEAEQYRRIARSVADAIVNPLDEPLVDPAFDRRLRGLYYPEWDVVPDWLRENQIEWMNKNNPKSSGSWTEDEVGQIFNAVRKKLMNTGVKGPERKVTSGRRIPKSELDSFEKRAREGLFDMMRKTYDSLLMSNDYDKEKANAKFAEMFSGTTIEFASDSAVLSGDVPFIDADGDRIDPQGYKIKPIRGFDQYERVMPTSAVADVVRDPAPAPSMPRAKTQRPPRGGKRVRNRNVIIAMEHGTLDEIIEAEEKGTTVDALRAISDPGNVYTKGPRKGMHRGPDTITVRDAETGELLHSNEILLTSSANRGPGFGGGHTAANRKRGYIRARSYAGRQDHNIVGEDNGKFTSSPNLRGADGKTTMTESDQRVYGLGSDEKNREYGLASRGNQESVLPDEYSMYGFTKDDLLRELEESGLDEDEAERIADYWVNHDGSWDRYMDRAIGDAEGNVRIALADAAQRAYESYLSDSADSLERRQLDGLSSRSVMERLLTEPTPQEEVEAFQNYLDSEYGEYFMEYTQMDDEELKRTLMRRYRMSRGEANQTARQIRKDEDTLDDLYMAADDAGMDDDGVDDDGFASRGGETEFPPLTRESLNAEIDRLIAKQQSLDTSDPDQLRQWERLEETIGLQIDRLASLPETAGNDGLASRGEIGLGSIRYADNIDDAAKQEILDSLTPEELDLVTPSKYDDLEWSVRRTPDGLLQFVAGDEIRGGRFDGEPDWENALTYDNEVGDQATFAKITKLADGRYELSWQREQVTSKFGGSRYEPPDLETDYYDGGWGVFDTLEEANKNILLPGDTEPSERLISTDNFGYQRGYRDPELPTPEGFASRGADAYWTEFPRGDEATYREYLAKLDAEAEAILEDVDANEYRDIREQLVEDGRLFGGGGDSTNDVLKAFQEEYREVVGLTRDEWNEAPRVVDFGDPGDMGFESRGNSDVVDIESLDFDDLSPETQDQIIQEGIESIDRVAQPDIDLEAERDFIVQDWNDRAKSNRAERAEKLLAEIADLMDGGADNDNPLQRNGNLLYAEELIKNTSYVSTSDLAEAQEIVDRIKRNGDDGDSGGLASRGPRRGGDDEGGVALDFDEADRAAFDQLPIAEQQRRTRAQRGRNNAERRELAIQEYADEWQYESDGEDGFGSRGAVHGAGIHNMWIPTERGDYGRDGLTDEEQTELRNEARKRKNQNLGEEIVPMDDGTGRMVPTRVHWGSRPNSQGVSAEPDWMWDFAPKGEWMEIGVGESSNVARVWIRQADKADNYFGNEVMVMFKAGGVYKYDDVIKPDLMKLLEAEDANGVRGSMGRSVRSLITRPDDEDGPREFTFVGDLRDAMAIVRGDSRDGGLASRGDRSDKIPPLSPNDWQSAADNGTRMATGEGDSIQLWSTPTDGTVADRITRNDDSIKGYWEISQDPYTGKFLVTAWKNSRNEFPNYDDIEDYVSSGRVSEQFDNVEDAMYYTDKLIWSIARDGEKAFTEIVRENFNPNYRPGFNRPKGFESRGGRTEQIDVRGSRAVEQVTYDPAKEELLVVYNGNRGYIYEGVTRGEADALIDAPSKGSAINGIKATHSFRKATDSDVMDFDIDPAAMRQAEVDANWERLPSADKERYLRRATNAGIADGTGESADELLSAAKLRAMDDREMAMLEREAIGRGESSSRRIDVSSSSALNYVDYDEKTRTLSVEFRGRDGNGTGTLYNYQGVEPEVVDELERSDSRGATMRRIRDNYEFTTSERLPQSAYEGLASRGRRTTDPKLRNTPKNRAKWTAETRLREMERDKTREDEWIRRYEQAGNELLDEGVAGYLLSQEPYAPFDNGLIRERMAEIMAREILAENRASGASSRRDDGDGFSSRGRMAASKEQIDKLRNAITSRDTPERRARYLRGDYPRSARTQNLDVRYSHDMFWEAVDAGDLDLKDFENLMGEKLATALRSVVPKLARNEEGLASRGGRRSTADMEAEFNELQASDGMLRQMGPGAAVRYRESLIKARNQAAKEMADAAGLDPKTIGSIYDVSTDDDDIGLLEAYDEAIDDVNGMLDSLRSEKSVAEAQEQASAKALGEAQELREKARRGSLYRRRDFDSDEEFIDSMREEYDFLLGDIREFMEGESEGESRDGMETATLEHDTYVFDDEAKAFNEFKGRIASAKTEAEFDQIRADMEQLMGGLVDSFEQRYRRDEANLDYDVPSVPDQDELEPEELGSFMMRDDGFSSRGGRQGRRRAPRQRWSEEDRRNFADRNFVRNRTRPGKRRQGPDAREWDGFASTGNDLEVRRSGTPADEVLDGSEVATDLPTSLQPTTFAGGEHGPGKDISMREMWKNYRRNNVGRRSRWLAENVTAEEFAEHVGIDVQTATDILSNRDSRADEVFIDDPYFADKLASAIGYGTGTRQNLFGFDPLEYIDESGNPARDIDSIEAAIRADRARREARLIARSSRRGKRDMVARGGAMTVADLERELQKIDPTIKLTNESGEPLSPGAMQRAVEKSGIPIPWSVEPYRQIVRAGGVLSPNQMSDLAKFGLIQGAPTRADIGASEGFQWPGFAGINSSRIFDAMAETLGISRDEVLERQPGIMRTIQENLAYARQGRRVARNMRTMRQGSIRMSRQQWKEMAERLGLDAAEFEKWFDTPIA